MIVAPTFSTKPALSTKFLVLLKINHFLQKATPFPQFPNPSVHRILPLSE